MDTTCKIIALISSAIAAVIFSGCSFGVEWQYHGRSGIDNRTQTQLVQDQEWEESKKERR